ncbi:MAG: hypothetical protein Q4C87_10805 [Actinomycetaceae bacterium]|nr:hypothetical protein [Actinomycetaceae bacterium]
MNYYMVSWQHDFPDEPVLIVSEVDDSRIEVRKIELFPDGSLGFADANYEGGVTTLSEQEYPPLEEIAASEEFQPIRIEESVFSALWNAAVKQ